MFATKVLCFCTCFGGNIIFRLVVPLFCHPIVQMLPYILAILVGAGSVGIYLAAFVLPELYRRSDPLWGGVGLFYALVLWVEAGRLTGGLLLGQVLSVLLLGWFVLQTICLRRWGISLEERTSLPEPLEKLWAANFPEQPIACSPCDRSAPNHPAWAKFT
jgi:hypothetical protein